MLCTSQYYQILPHLQIGSSSPAPRADAGAPSTHGYLCYLSTRAHDAEPPTASTSSGPGTRTGTGTSSSTGAATGAAAAISLPTKLLRLPTPTPILRVTRRSTSPSHPPPIRACCQHFHIALPRFLYPSLPILISYPSFLFFSLDLTRSRLLSRRARIWQSAASRNVHLADRLRDAQRQF